MAQSDSCSHHLQEPLHNSYSTPSSQSQLEACIDSQCYGQGATFWNQDITLLQDDFHSS